MTKKLNIKNAVKKVGTTIVDAGKVAVVLVASVATAEAAFAGAEMMQNDAEVIKEGVKYKVKPDSRTPVKVKEKGFRGKTKVVTINPITGQMDHYTGNKKPVNKKPIKVAK